MDSTLYCLWLAEALGSGCRLAGRLLEEYPDPAELYGQVKAGWNPPESPRIYAGGGPGPDGGAEKALR